uniref:Uncharacterized protein n=1 Tax=Anopheles coluzzii TaxID=1518534 RepID=A0A8W7PTZ3_ANOCL
MVLLLLLPVPTSGVPLIAVHPEKDGQKHDQHTDHAEERDPVLVDQAGQQYGNGLPERHDDREHDRPKRSDRVEDEQLPDGGRDRQHHTVDHKLRMVDGKHERAVEAALHRERRPGEQCAEQVHPAHHLYRAHRNVSSSTPVSVVMADAFDSSVEPVRKKIIPTEIMTAVRYS